jgi:hypothetical protein
MDQQTFKLKRLKDVFLNLLFFIFGLLLPSQLGKHFWMPFSYLESVRIDYLAVVFYLSDFILIALAGLTLFDKKYYRLINKHRRLVFGLGFSLLFLFFIAEFKGLFFLRLWQYLRIVVAFLIFKNSSKKESGYFLKGLFIASLYTLGLSLLQISRQGSVQGIWWLLGERRFSVTTPGISTITIFGQKVLRAYGSFSHPNALAGFFQLTYWLFVLCCPTFYAIAALLLVILSFSKANILILALLLIYKGIKTSKNCAVCKIASILFASWLFFLALIIVNNPSSLSERLTSYQDTLVYIIKNPFGVSLGHYLHPLLKTKYQPVHNVFLLYIMETGIIGIIWLGIFLKSIKIKSVLQKMSLPVIFFLFVSGSIDHYHLTQVQNQLLLGTVIGILFKK